MHNWHLICEEGSNNINPSNESDKLLAHVTQCKPLPPGDSRQVLSNAKTPSSANSANQASNTEITVIGVM